MEIRSAGDADYRHVREIRSEEFHHLRLADLVERRCRLVHDHNVRWIDEQAGKGEPLLLASDKVRLQPFSSSRRVSSRDSRSA
jgi:hypothetical protein